MTIVLRKELQNISKALPSHCVSMRGAGFCKDYAGTPLRASRFHWGTQVLSYYAMTSAAECTQYVYSEFYGGMMVNHHAVAWLITVIGRHQSWAAWATHRVKPLCAPPVSRATGAATGSQPQQIRPRRMNMMNFGIPCSRNRPRR